MLPGSPLVWLALAGWLATGVTYGVQEFQKGRQWRAAYDKGFGAGEAAASKSTVVAATETARAEREAAEATPIPADKSAVTELCKRRASCRERGMLR